MRRFSTEARGAVRVLIVDDDGVLVRSLERVLSRQGFEVDTALDGRAALARLQEREYDVMLLDLRMGGMDGLEVYAMAPNQSPPATIIHSAHIDVRTAVLATRAGVQDVMQKPVPEEQLAARIRELAAEHRQMRQYPRSEPAEPETTDGRARLVGRHPRTGELRDQMQRVAKFRDVSVLVQGATGTGKELVAQALHTLTCPSEPFVSLNCAAVPEQLFESELFGHEAGAFTNARTARVGLFEEAAGGTLFLDEVGEMPLALQAKLLRVLEVRQFRRLGGSRNKVFAARVISATNRPLTSSLGGALRPDLFFRLAGYTLRVPTLCERASDIPELAQYFLNEFAKRHQVMGLSLAPGAVALLQRHSWPGNIRELRAVVENAAILTRSGHIDAEQVSRALGARSDEELPESGSGPVAAAEPLPPEPTTQVSAVVPTASARSASLPDVQRALILKAFEESQHNLSKAALDLGIPRSTLRARLKRYGVR